MIESVVIKNLGINELVEWRGLGKINVLIGKNGSGKTSVLKMIYSMLKSLEANKKGNEQRPIETILAEKLYWTFQTDKLGDLVCKFNKGPLYAEITEDNNQMQFEFGSDTNTKIGRLSTNYEKSRENTTIFIPAKEVLSLFSVILKSREQDNVFGFDDTYLDLVRALRIPTQMGKNYSAFADGRKALQNMIDGSIMYDDKMDKWYFKRGRNKFSIGVTSEGVKKISIFNQLLANRYLTPHSTIIIDEPESSLHPRAVSEFMDILFSLASCGMQIFIATHSYFVIKKLCLLAQKNDTHIPVLSLSDSNEAKYDDMINGMPYNSIIEESVRIYKEEMDFTFGVEK